MIWNKPRNGWQWLLLLVPGVEIILVEVMPVRWASYLFPHDEIPDLTIDLLNLPIVFLLSIGIAAWLNRHCSNGDRLIARAFGFGVLIGLANVAIGFVGCTAGHSLLDKR